MTVKTLKEFLDIDDDAKVFIHIKDENGVYQPYVPTIPEAYTLDDADDPNAKIKAIYIRAEKLINDICEFDV